MIVDATTEKGTMIRSSSMPVKPKPLDPRPLSRSPEKETVNDNETDYYPESPSCLRRRKSKQVPEHLETRSEQKWVNWKLRISNALNNLIVLCAYSFPYTLDWAGSTVELSPDADADVDGLRRRMHRVMEKNGHENVVFRRIPEKSWRYMRDAITTLVRFMFGHKANKSNTLADRSHIYSITPSIQQRLDELAKESPKERVAKPISHTQANLEATANPIDRERVTFSI